MLLFFLLAAGSAAAFLQSHPGLSMPHHSILSRIQAHSITRRFLSSTEITSSLDRETESLRKWFTLTGKRRPEITLSEAASSSAIVAELWKAVLVSLRVLENDQSLTEHLNLLAVSKYQLPESNAEIDTDLRRFQAIVSSINADQSSLLFQPNFKRTISVLLKPLLGDGSGASIVFVIDTKRTSPAIVDFEDIDEFTPAVEDAVTNDIPAFPFPTVFDFISEINRPPDPLTMSQLTFDYKVTDFKYDLAKMAKKKNPQEVLKSINCKLTRLQKWREILSQPNKNDLPDPFVDAASWSESVKLKYQSLKSLAKSDGKLALDTQYDKRTTFIKIIDLWSDRLKRSFKFTYFASKRPQEDFQQAILDSKWRNEVLNTTRLLAECPFLSFGGPTFTPGNPTPIFKEDRFVMYDSSYPVELVLYEMLTWLKSMKVVEEISGFPSFGPITQHTYSRGLVTERVMFDVWQGLAQWFGETKPKRQLNLSAALLSESLSLKGNHRALPISNQDHTDAFFSSLREINSMSRKTSFEASSSVKDFYKSYYGSGTDLVDWWTTLVRDLDLTDAMDKKTEEREEPWSAIIARTIAEENLKEGRGSDGSLDAVAAAEAADEAKELWANKYKTVLEFAEKLNSALPWTTALEERPSVEGLERFSKQVPLRNETVTLDFEEPSVANSSFLYVTPRFFRGIGMDEELVRCCLYPSLLLPHPTPLPLALTPLLSPHCRVPSWSLPRSSRANCATQTLSERPSTYPKSAST